MKCHYLYKMIYSTIIIIVIIFLFYHLDFSPKNVTYKLYTPFINPFNINQEYSFKKIYSDIPKMNSAIATYPFVSKLVESTINKNYYNNELEYVSTFQAYQSIINNETDFSIASETNDYQKTIIEKITDIKLVPIAKEALIFFVNKDNPINTLSIYDLNDIYNENFTNWSELGGKDEILHPYQLNKDIGGSEECFSQVIKNNSLYTNNSLIAYDMKNIIDLTVEDSGGIGYAFNMFETKLYNLKSIKKVSIDNISPNYENIVLGKYPLMFNVYFIYRESTTNPNVEKILNWLLSEEGQKLVAQSGYQPIKKY